VERTVDKDLKARLAGIKLLVLDVDGVLTDGSIFMDDEGRELKRFHVRDGMGLVLAGKAGLHLAVISGRSCQAVACRMNQLGITRVFQGVQDKISVMMRLVRELGLSLHQVAVMGDDLPELPLFKVAEIAASVPGAPLEVRQCADIVTESSGGNGAVRELVEMILKSSGSWESCVGSWTG